MNLMELTNLIDSQVEALLERDPFWRKCYPCKNNGRCCQNDSPLATADEFAALEAFLLGKLNIWQTVYQNLKDGRNCIFYAPDASACLVHELRPIICRLTPFKAYAANPKKPEITVFDSLGNTGCGYFLKKCRTILDIDGIFARTDQNSYILVNNLFAEGGFLKNACRIDILFRRKYPETILPDKNRTYLPIAATAH